MPKKKNACLIKSIRVKNFNLSYLNTVFLKHTRADFRTTDKTIYTPFFSLSCVTFF